MSGVHTTKPVTAWASIMRVTSNVEDEYVTLRVLVATPEDDYGTQGRTQVDMKLSLEQFGRLLTGASDVKGEAVVRVREPRQSAGIRPG